MKSKNLIILILSSFIFLTKNLYALTIELPPSQISLNTLFTEVIISNEYQGWQVVRSGELSAWAQDSYRNIKILTAIKNNYPAFAHSMTKNPVEINKDSNEFFKGLCEINYPTNGTYIGIKYAFYPQSFISSFNDRNSQSVIFFYLIKEKPGDLINEELPELLKEKILSYPLSIEAEKQIIQNYIGLYSCIDVAEILYSCFLTYLTRPLFKSIADAQITQGELRYAQMLENGYGGERNLNQACQYYRLAANKGCVCAQKNLAALLLENFHIPKDLQEARQYYQLAADQGDNEARVRYGMMLENGQGGEVDLKKAEFYYQNTGMLKLRLKMMNWIYKFLTHYDG